MGYHPLVLSGTQFPDFFSFKPVSSTLRLAQGIGVPKKHQAPAQKFWAGAGALT